MYLYYVTLTVSKDALADRVVQWSRLREVALGGRNKSTTVVQDDTALQR